jgi:hypothetical protein
MLKEKAKQQTAHEKRSAYIIERRLHPYRDRTLPPLDGIKTWREAPGADDERD